LDSAACRLVAHAASPSHESPSAPARRVGVPLLVHFACPADPVGPHLGPGATQWQHRGGRCRSAGVVPMSGADQIPPFHDTDPVTVTVHRPERKMTLAVLTYRRPDDLAEILPMLLDQARRVDVDCDVLVVDNDVAGEGPHWRPSWRSAGQIGRGAETWYRRRAKSCPRRDSRCRSVGLHRRLRAPHRRVARAPDSRPSTGHRVPAP